MTKFDEYLATLGLVADKWTKPNHDGWVNPYIDGKIHYGFRSVPEGFQVNDFRKGKIYTVTDDGIVNNPTPVKVEKDTSNFKAEYQFIYDKRTDAKFKRLEGKGVSQYTGFMSGNNFYLPYYQEVCGEVVGCQVQNEDGQKWSIKGSSITGAFNILQQGKSKSKDRPMGFICEGYTTACQLADLFPNAFVACASGMGQLVKVYQTLQEEYSHMAIIVALDKSHKYKINKALLSVRETMDKLKIPYIQPDNNDPEIFHVTDFNDCVMIQGKEPVLQYIVKAYNKVAPLMPEVLPNTGSAHKIISYHRGGLIVSIPYSRELDLIKDISPAMLEEYKRYNFSDEKTSKGDVMKKLIKDVLHDSNNNTQFYGQGVYNESDEDKFVFNLCGGRYVSSRQLGLYYDPRNRYSSGSYYVDVPNDRAVCLDLSQPLDVNDLLKMYMATSALYKRGKYFWFLLAHLAQACYAGFSQFRAHTWILGPTGSGKSLFRTLMNILGKGLTVPVQDVTKAGLAQLLNADGIQMSPVILADETAADTKNKQENIDEIIKSMRAMSNASDDTLSLRGTSEQKVKIYKSRASMLLASTTSYIKDPQDRARITEFNIEFPVGNDKSHEIQEAVELFKMMNPKFLVSIMKNAHLYEEAVKLAEERLNRIYKHPTTSHKIRVYAAYVAGLACVRCGTQIEFGDNLEPYVRSAYNVIRQILNEDYMSQFNFVQTNNNIVDKILNFNTVLNGANSRATIRELLDNPNEANNLYLQYGIKKTSNNKMLINVTNYKLDQLLEARKLVVEPLYDSLSLLREAIAQQLEGIKEYPTKCHITGKSIRCYSIDLPQLEEKESGIIPLSKASS